MIKVNGRNKKVIAIDHELTETIKVWPRVSKTISTIHTKAHYNKVINLLDKLIDSLDEKKDPFKESLIDTLGTLIKDYEDRNLAEPEADPLGNLKYLMAEHEMNQRDLTEIGSQGVVSEILNGKRELNVRQIKALSKRFHASPIVFLGKDR